jgi:hypothetical protein
MSQVKKNVGWRYQNNRIRIIYFRITSYHLCIIYVSNLDDYLIKFVIKTQSL